MKSPMNALVIAALLATGGSLATAETASAFVVKERHVMVGNGHRGPIRDTMYRWGNPYGGYYPGTYRAYPRYYPGVYWGGYQIYSRPIYAGAYASCGWTRIPTPWGPRWRPICI